jgi:hypothetical protein
MHAFAPCPALPLPLPLLLALSACRVTCTSRLASTHPAECCCMDPRAQVRRPLLPPLLLPPLLLPPLLLLLPPPRMKLAPCKPRASHHLPRCDSLAQLLEPRGLCHLPPLCRQDDACQGSGAPHHRLLHSRGGLRVCAEVPWGGEQSGVEGRREEAGRGGTGGEAGRPRGWCEPHPESCPGEVQP